MTSEKLAVDGMDSISSFEECKRRGWAYRGDKLGAGQDDGTIYPEDIDLSEKPTCKFGGDDYNSVDP
jgi:hypothetical protein